MPYLNWNWKDEILKELKEKLHRILTSLQCSQKEIRQKVNFQKENWRRSKVSVVWLYAWPMPYLNWNWKDEILKELKEKLHRILISLQCRPEGNSTKSQLPERELKEIQSFCGMIVGMTHAIPELKLERWNSQRIERESSIESSHPYSAARRKFDKKSTSRKRTEGDPKFLLYDCRPDPCHTWTEIGKMKFSKNWKRNSIKSSHPYSADQKEIQQKVNFQKENWRRSKVSMVWL